MRDYTMKKEDDISNPEVRAKYAYMEGCVSIIVNSLLFVFKLYLGLMISSIALVTDAFHTLSDTATSIVVILGFKSSKKAPDGEHPFGHGRMEYVITLVIAVLLFVAGAEFILESVRRLLEDTDNIKSDYLLFIGAAVMLSSLAKEALARFSMRLGKKIDSTALVADAWHHRSDALTSIAVGLAIIGAHYDLYILDPIFGIVVAVLIIYTAIILFRFSSDTLVGKSPDSETIEAIANAAQAVDGVAGAHKITVHDYGPTKVVSLHVEVGCDISAESAHNIAQSVEDRITEITKSPTIVHVDPDKEPFHDIREIERIVTSVLEQTTDILFYHNVRIISMRDESRIEMHIVVDSDMSVSDSHELIHKIKGLLQKSLPGCKVATHIEPCTRKCETCPGICKK
jgi:cation diffusion facilitator family transporter